MRVLAEATDRSPSVVFDNNTLTISGRSYMSDTIEFYKQLYAKVDSIVTDKMEVVMSLEHFNSTSSKCILELFNSLQQKQSTGMEVNIIWKYQTNYLEMLEAGEDFRDFLEGRIKFELVEIPDEQ